MRNESINSSDKQNLNKSEFGYRIRVGDANHVKMRRSYVKSQLFYRVSKMKDDDKKEQIINELAELRRCVLDLEKSFPA